MMPRPGAVVLVGPAAGCQFAGGRRLVMRVIHARHANWDGMAWIEGYVLNEHGAATGRREVYVQVNGLRHIERPAHVVRHRNAGPTVPRPRTTTENTRRNR